MGFILRLGELPALLDFAARCALARHVEHVLIPANSGATFPTCRAFPCRALSPSRRQRALEEAAESAKRWARG